MKLSLSKIILSPMLFVYNPRWKFREPAKSYRRVAPLSGGRSLTLAFGQMRFFEEALTPLDAKPLILREVVLPLWDLNALPSE